MSQSSAITLLRPILSATFLLSCGCLDMPEDSTLGAEFVDSQTKISLIDTFSVSLSTVILDPLVTSGNGTALIGTYGDSEFGKIVCDSYAQLGPADNFSLLSTDLFDSLCLVLRYDHYYYGDTTLPQRILVHRVTEAITYDRDNSIISSSSFAHETSPVGTLTFSPRPFGSDSLSVRLDHTFGEELFGVLVDHPEVMQSDESFEKYFHGIVLKSDSAFGGVVTGFQANSDDLKLVMYMRDGSSLQASSLEFPLVNTSKQFNRISHNFRSTPLGLASSQREELPSGVTGGSAYLQGGVGLSIRVDFPTLSEALLFKRAAILSAKLSISPRLGSHGTFGLPSQLVANETNGVNEVLGAVASSSFAVDELFNERTAYTFEIKDFLVSELSDSFVNPEKGLLITLESADQSMRFHRLVANASSAKLSIYYLFY